MDERIFIVIDIETTGISPDMAEITEIGALKVKGGDILGSFSTLVDPGCPIPEKITEITGITDSMVAGKPTIVQVLSELTEFCGNHALIGHNIPFDYSFLKTNAVRYGMEFEKDGLDTLALARTFLPGLESRSLSYLIEHLGIERENAHRAYDDALATFRLFRYFVENHQEEGKEHCFVPRPLHFKPKKTAPLTARQASYLRALVDRYGIALEKPLENLSKSEASREIDSILFKYGKPQ